MPNNGVNQYFDSVFEREGNALWRLCFLITMEEKAANTLCFDALLRFGAARKEPDDPKEFLFHEAVRLGMDWYGKKLRKKPRYDKIDRSRLAFPLSEEQIHLLRSPLAKRMAAGLLLAGFDCGQITRIGGRAAGREAGKINGEELAQAEKMQVTEEALRLISDRVYDRFSERNVRLENAIHGFRERFDRAAPFLALLVLAFFAFCAWFSLR